jgi:hypothetical protein
MLSNIGRKTLLNRMLEMRLNLHTLSMSDNLIHYPRTSSHTQSNPNLAYTFTCQHGMDIRKHINANITGNPSWPVLGLIRDGHMKAASPNHCAWHLSSALGSGPHPDVETPIAIRNLRGSTLPPLLWSSSLPRRAWAHIHTRAHSSPRASQPQHTSHSLPSPPDHGPPAAAELRGRRYNARQRGLTGPATLVGLQGAVQGRAGAGRAPPCALEGERGGAGAHAQPPAGALEHPGGRACGRELLALLVHVMLSCIRAHQQSSPQGCHQATDSATGQTRSRRCHFRSHWTS